MASPRQSRPPAGLARMASMSSSGSGHQSQPGLARSATMSTGSIYAATETSRSEFQDQLCELATSVGVPLALPRSLLSLPTQRAAPPRPSDKTGAEEYLKSLRPKRLVIGTSKKGFEKDEVLLAVDKAIGSKKSTPLIEGLIQIAESTGANSGNSGASFTKDKKGQLIPTFNHLFTQAEHARLLDVWKLFLGRVYEGSLDASLALALKEQTNDIERIKLLLEYGAHPELCQDRIFELIASGSEDLVEILLSSPLVTNVEFLSQALVKAVSNGSLRNTSMLLLRGANGNHGQGSALKAAISAQRYDLALAIVTLTQAPVSSSSLDDATKLINPWSREDQGPFLKMLLYAGASGRRTSEAILPFIAAHDQDIISNLTECTAFRHSTFPAPRLFIYAVDSGKFELAFDILRSSNNRSFSDYAGTGVHLQLVREYPEDAEQIHKLLSELLTLGVSGDYTSQMLVASCAQEQIDEPHIMTLINLLLGTGGAKVNYSEGKALMSAIEAAKPTVVSALVAAKPTKKILSSAVARASSTLTDRNAAKLEIMSTLIKAGASGTIIDEELVSAVDKTPLSLKKIKVLLKGASLDHSEGKAIVKAVELGRLDIVETMLSEKTPQSMTFTSIWKQTRKLFALAESGDGELPYGLDYMKKIFEMLHVSAKGAAPVNDLLVDATRCCSLDIALNLASLFLRWGGTPNHAVGAPLQACIKRSDTKTLAILLEAEPSKQSLRYGFQEALKLRGKVRYAMLETMIGAGLERSVLDAALPQVLKESSYDSTTAQLIVGAGATLHSSFGDNLVSPSLNLDLQVVEKLLTSVSDKHSVLMPLKAVLDSRKDWQSPDGVSVPMVKLLVRNCGKGTWADGYFITAVKSCNQHAATLVSEYLTSNSIYSDALQALLVVGTAPLDRERLSMAQYLLKNGAKGAIIDEYFVLAASTLELEWVTGLSPYISNRSVAISAFDIVQNGREGAPLSGNRLEIIQFLLKQGLDGPIVDEAFVKSASTADVKGMNDFLDFVTSKDAFSDSLEMLAKQEDLLVSREGLVAVKILISKGASNSSVENAARTSSRARNLAATKLIVGLAPQLSIHAAFQGLMENPQPLSSSNTRSILFYLLEIGLGHEDAEHVACLAATRFDIPVIKALAPLENSRNLHECAVNAIQLSDKTWLSTNGLEFVDYLIGKGISTSSINRLLEAASEELSLSAIRMLLTAFEDKSKAVELAFSSVVSDKGRWTSKEGLHVVNFLLEYGAKGLAVEEAAAYAAETSNFDALDIFLRSPAAGSAIPAAFKALTRSKPGQLSSEQLTIASTLVQQGVSTEILAIAAIEMAKILDIEGLKVLSGSPRFRQVTDNVLRALLFDENLWRTPEGHLIIRFLIEKGASTEMIEAAASKAAASLDIDGIRNVFGSETLFSVVEAALISLTGLEKGWLCPEGLRIMDYLLHREPSEGGINKAFVQASQYLYFDAVKLLEPTISEHAVFNDALSRAVNTDTDWLSELRLIGILLESGAKGAAVELALTEAARALNLPALELLAPYIDRPEVYTKALAAATEEDTQEWKHHLDIIEFLLGHGASGDPVGRAYLSASEALDLPAVTLLYPYITDDEIHSQAFRAATSNESWSSPNYLDVLKFLHTEQISPDVVGMALVAGAQALNVLAVESLSRGADEDVCSEAFKAATQDVKKWTSEEGTKVVQILAEKGACGDAVDDALIKSAKLFRLDLVTMLVPNIDKENFGPVSLALDALLSNDGSEKGDAWVSNPDAVEILHILVSMGANGDSAHGKCAN